MFTIDVFSMIEKRQRQFQREIVDGDFQAVTNNSGNFLIISSYIKISRKFATLITRTPLTTIATKYDSFRLNVNNVIGKPNVS